MPWHVAKTSACPDSRPWGVIKDSTGEIEGCHSTRARAERQMRALYDAEEATQVGTADDLNDAVARARKAARPDEVALAAAYDAQLRNLLAQAVRRYKDLAGLGGLVASAEWTPPTVADVLNIHARMTRIRGAQRRMLSRLAGTVSSVRGVDFDLLHPVVQETLDQLGSRIEDALIATLREPVAAAIARGWAEGLSVRDTGNLIRRDVGPQLGAKADALARTDLNRMSNAGSHLGADLLNESAKAAGERPPIQTKTWLSSRDGRVRQTHVEADGQTVPFDQPFSVGGEALMYPGDWAGSSAEVMNCRCTTLMNEAPPPQKPPDPQPGDAVVPLEGRTDAMTRAIGDFANTKQKYQLPDGTYTPERERLHATIIRHFTEKGRTVPETERPQATFLAGGSGAGKSTVKKTLIESGKIRDNFVDIDPDAIKEMLPEYRDLLSVGDEGGALAAHEESSDIAKMVLKEANRMRSNIVVDGTGDAGPGKFLGKLRAQDQEGYDVDVVMVDIPTKEALARAAKRAERTGRRIPEETIRNIHQEVAARFDEWRDSEHVRSWELWDNTDRPPVLFAERRDGMTLTHDYWKFMNFQRKARGREPLPKPETVSYEEMLPLDRLTPESRLSWADFQIRDTRDSVADAIAFIEKTLSKRPLDAAQQRLRTSYGRPELPIVERTEGVARGSFHYREKFPQDIRIRFGEKQPGVTMAHEFGHFLDHQVFSIEGGYVNAGMMKDRVTPVFAGVPKAGVKEALTELMDAARNTRTLQALRFAKETRQAILGTPKKGALLDPDNMWISISDGNVAWAEYAYDEIEVWARLFAQWCARHPDAGEWIRREMEAEVSDQQNPWDNAIFLPGQWSDDEMDMLTPLIENVLRSVGLLDDGLVGGAVLADEVDPRSIGTALVEPREPRPRGRLRHAVVLDKGGDDLLVGHLQGTQIVHVDHASQSTSGGTWGRACDVQWGEHAKEEVRDGDPVRRGAVGRSGRVDAFAVPHRRGTPRVPEDAADPGGAEGAGGGAASARGDARGRVAAGTPEGAAIAFEDDHEREGTAMSATETENTTEITAGGAWESDLAFEGMSTGDGRFIVEGALGHRELPLTLMAMVETPDFGGHAGAQVAGRIDAIEKSRKDMDGDPLPDGVASVRGRGVFDVGEFGLEIERMVRDEVLRGVSIDMAINEWAFRDPGTGEVIDPDDATEEQWERAFVGEMEMAITSGDIMAATVCPTPAFADAKIALLASGRSFGHFWRANEFAARRFGIAEGTLCTSVYATLRPVVEDGALTAAASAPVKPPREWFFRPEADRATPLTFTPDGQVYGHIAAWESCHTGFINGAWSQCVTPPRSNTEYAHFHVGEIPTKEGDLIPVGKLMLGEAHAPGANGRAQARAFYDRTGTVGAYVRARDGKHGIWVSGSIRDGLTDEQYRDLHVNPPSGDWRAVDRNLELIAALAVPVPGFPIPRSQMSLAASADGEMYVSTLILTGGVEAQGFGHEADALAAAIEGPDALDALIAGA